MNVDDDGNEGQEHEAVKLSDEGEQREEEDGDGGGGGMAPENIRPSPGDCTARVDCNGLRVTWPGGCGSG